MPLTPEDVRNKQFSTVRLREGYDMDEVDAFLDEVEAELTRLGRDNEDLRVRLSTAARQPWPRRHRPPRHPSQQAPPPPPGAGTAAPTARRSWCPSPAPSDSAVRMLELAQRTADEHVARAKAEGEQIVAQAKQEAERVTGDLRREQVTLEARVEELKAFEREYRTRLRSYLEGQLRDLDTLGDVAPRSREAQAPAQAPTPSVAPAVAPPAPAPTPTVAPPPRATATATAARPCSGTRASPSPGAALRSPRSSPPRSRRRPVGQPGRPATPVRSAESRRPRAALGSASPGLTNVATDGREGRDRIAPVPGPHGRRGSSCRVGRPGVLRAGALRRAAEGVARGRGRQRDAGAVDVDAGERHDRLQDGQRALAGLEAGLRSPWRGRSSRSAGPGCRRTSRPSRGGPSRPARSRRPTGGPTPGCTRGWRRTGRRGSRPGCARRRAWCGSRARPAPAPGGCGWTAPGRRRRTP